MTDHKKEALSWLQNAAQEANIGGYEEVIDHSYRAAQVHATLYLAEQQRVANLIALAHGARGGGIGLEEIALDGLRILHVSTDGPWGNQTVELRPEIRDALGLDG